MDASKSISIIYEIICNAFGPARAKETVLASLHRAISEIQEDNLVVTPELIEEKLKIYANDFLEASGKKTA